MSAHFDVSTISFFGLDEWSVAVCAWRGCCMEVFSRAEHSVADCLRTLEGAGIAVGKDARSPFAGTRLKALKACVDNEIFGPHGKTALTRISAWEKVYETRAPLAHGLIKSTREGVSVQHIAFDGKVETRAKPWQISRVAMLETLADMEQAQVQLHQQLGQIKAIAGKMKPLALTKPQKPNPETSPG